MSHLKLKVLLVGPEKCGKSQMANFLAELTENLPGPGAPHTPTAGVRILEFDRQLGDGQSKNSWERDTKVAIELWDVSGHHQYEACWPAVMKDSDAVILMYNVENQGHIREIELWYEFFIQNAGLSDQQCVAFAHRSDSQKLIPKVKNPRIGQVPIIGTAADDESLPIIQKEFDTFVQELI
jgi:Rab-like protein 5